MEKVDRWLARTSYGALYVAFVVCMVFSGDGEHRPLSNGVVNLVGVAMAPFLWRSMALRGGRSGWYRPPVRLRRAARAFVLGNRLPVALAYGALASWFAQWHYDVPWFSVLHGTVSAIAIWYATSPLPEQERAATA